MNGIKYNVSDYEANLWKYRKLVDDNAADAERNGTRKVDGFGGFAADVFHRMFADQVRERGELPAGADVFVELHGQLDRLPEVEDLAARCTGDEIMAGIGTAAVIDSLVAAVPEGAGTEAIAEDAEARDMLEALLDSPDLDEQAREDIAEQVEELTRRIAERAEAAAEAAEQLDGSEVRGALRKAAKAAAEACDEHEALVDGFMAGTGRNASKAMRADTARKLAGLTANREAIKRVAEIAGRLRRVAMAEQDKKARKGTDEVVGVETGRDLERVIAAEWAASDDPELADLFLARYTEGSLVQLDIEAKNPEGRGPIVVCVDCSASMRGANEAWAGACVLAFLEIATRQQRALSVVYFDSGVRRVETFEPGERDLDKVLGAVLLDAAGGGTSWEAPLTKAAEIVQRDRTMKNADVILLTDGACSVGSAWLDAYNETAAAVPFRTYSILIGCGATCRAADGFSAEVVNLADVMRDEGVARIFGRV
jgi:uncharacterized protein with von Willebrand factor type A (vWA) domain